MITTVRLNDDNFIIDKSTGEVIERYDPNNKNVELHLTLPDSTLIVDGTNIVQEFGGNVVVQYNADRYIIDDGYANTLIKSGYIVYKDYDRRHETNLNRGKEMRDNIISSIRDLLPDITAKYNHEDTCLPSTLFYDGTETRMNIGDERDHFQYMIKFNTINSIVNKNHVRKDNSLAFYPFDKSMDRYGTIYVSVFAQKNYYKHNDPDKYSLPDSIIRDIVSQLGIDYHYISMPVKGRVLWWPGV